MSSSPLGMCDRTESDGVMMQWMDHLKVQWTQNMIFFSDFAKNLFLKFWTILHGIWVMVIITGIVTVPVRLHTNMGKTMPMARRRRKNIDLCFKMDSPSCFQKCFWNKRNQNLKGINHFSKSKKQWFTHFFVPGMIHKPHFRTFQSISNLNKNKNKQSCKKVVNPPPCFQGGQNKGGN